ncbi:probable isoaspartyl peptidase/L-asparaginase GA20639 [Sabethes cyaneus]|uniref:probable isoaspartyl peptidase/L-asparaginase GA20639 n=1 Tax=Sabethes cyaneus TaxID=53552 RepID=UPI00237E6201|nr:probable isoaspartyl peptidase/L-asparaginase GA20639 [Sabethes cyaneus]XP_053694295.1 probable isoaspartyl peptidase/L-asparaginase GA20639 [Sabethes cyaneus]XP_053694302.1 probable isoaspartyl peptidase/L-asparaginase GA20639 [Sabethes cyaneus]
MLEPIILVHGGAGDIPDERVDGKLVGVKLAAKTGFNTLRKTGSVLDAVEEAVRSMELDPYFNAGYGSVLTTNATVEMEASIMNGVNLRSGCATLVKDIMHPITLARRVMNTPHNFLAGDGIMELAEREKFEILLPGQLITDYAREALEEWKEDLKAGKGHFARTEIGSQNKYKRTETETVGAVAIDCQGNIAVATSTGGITGKLPGRVGDTPLIGAGTYADNLVGGVSTTGHGETIIKYCLAHAILKRIDFLKEDAQVATENACEAMTERLIGKGGAITIDYKGQVGVSFTSDRMAWAYLKGNSIHYGIEKNQHLQEKL